MLPHLNHTQITRVQAAILDSLGVPNRPVIDLDMKLAVYAEVIGLGIHESARVLTLAIQLESYLADASPNHIDPAQLSAVSGYDLATCINALRLHGGWNIGVSHHRVVPESLFN